MHRCYTLFSLHDADRGPYPENDVPLCETCRQRVICASHQQLHWYITRGDWYVVPVCGTRYLYLVLYAYINTVASTVVCTESTFIYVIYSIQYTVLLYAYACDEIHMSLMVLVQVL